MLSMLARNRTIKTRPEKFQATKDEFDVVITCETRVFDQVVQCSSRHSNFSRTYYRTDCKKPAEPEKESKIEDSFKVFVCLLRRKCCLYLSDIYAPLCSAALEEKEQESCEPVHICNVEIKDTHEEATVGALAISKLCGMVSTDEFIADALLFVVQNFLERLKKARVVPPSLGRSDMARGRHFGHFSDCGSERRSPSAAPYVQLHLLPGRRAPHNLFLSMQFRTSHLIIPSARNEYDRVSSIAVLMSSSR